MENRYVLRIKNHSDMSFGQRVCWTLNPSGGYFSSVIAFKQSYQSRFTEIPSITFPSNKAVADSALALWSYCRSEIIHTSSWWALLKIWQVFFQFQDIFMSTMPRDIVLEVDIHWRWHPLNFNQFVKKMVLLLRILTKQWPSTWEWQQKIDQRSWITAGWEVGSQWMLQVTGHESNKNYEHKHLT